MQTFTKSTEQTTTKDTDAANLEAAVPSLIAKLREVQANLLPEEKVIFGDIIESAALHTQAVQSHDEGRHDVKMYIKPRSAYATTGMKKQYAQLDTLLGIR